MIYREYNYCRFKTYFDSRQNARSKLPTNLSRLKHIYDRLQYVWCVCFQNFFNSSSFLPFNFIGWSFDRLPTNHGCPIKGKFPWRQPKHHPLSRCLLPPLTRISKKGEMDRAFRCLYELWKCFAFGRNCPSLYMYVGVGGSVFLVSMLICVLSFWLGLSCLS